MYIFIIIIIYKLYIFLKTLFIMCIVLLKVKNAVYGFFKYIFLIIIMYA